MTDKIEQDDRALFKIYSEKCVRCYHLFPTHSKSVAHNSCHFSKGNSLCPAQEVKIVVATNSKNKAANLKKSFEEDDIQGAIEQLQKLVKLSEKERRGILSNIIASDNAQTEEPKKIKKPKSKDK
jgi:hypothetical protein